MQGKMSIYLNTASCKKMFLSQEYFRPLLAMNDVRIPSTNNLALKDLCEGSTNPTRQFVPHWTALFTSLLFTMLCNLPIALSSATEVSLLSHINNLSSFKDVLFPSQVFLLLPVKHAQCFSPFLLFLHKPISNEWAPV